MEVEAEKRGGQLWERTGLGIQRSAIEMFHYVFDAFYRAIPAPFHTLSVVFFLKSLLQM